MREAKLGDVIYKVKPLTPSALPYSNLIGKLVLRQPETLEEAKKIEEEINQTYQKIFEYTVTPKPTNPSIFNDLLDLISEETNKVIEQANSFRKQP